MRRTGWVYWLKRDLDRLPKDGRPLSQSGKLEEMARVREMLRAEINRDETPELRTEG